MRRREFLGGLSGAAVVWPLAARAQQTVRMRRIGVLMATSETDVEGKVRLRAFIDALKPLGWIEDRNVRLDLRWTGGDSTLSRRFAREIVASSPDVILSQNTASVPPLIEATKSIPVVFTQVSEPVEAGFVTSMASPGGNLTGFTSFEPIMGGKWIEILKEFAPQVARVSIIFNPDASASRGVNFLRYAAEAGLRFGTRVSPSPFREVGEIESALANLSSESNGGVVVLPDAGTNANRNVILELAGKYSLPSVYAFPFFVKAGGLVSYGPNPIEQFQKAAGYVDRILNGGKAADLPVQAPTKFELVVNVKAAKSLGLTVPPTLLARADEVIE